jgi:hypothetical protein
MIYKRHERCHLDVTTEGHREEMGKAVNYGSIQAR